MKKGNDVSDSLFRSLEFLKEFTNQLLDDVSSTNKKLIWSKINRKVIKLMILSALIIFQWLNNGQARSQEFLRVREVSTN